MPSRHGPWARAAVRALAPPDLVQPSPGLFVIPKHRNLERDLPRFGHGLKHATDGVVQRLDADNGGPPSPPAVRKGLGALDDPYDINDRETRHSPRPEIPEH